MRELLVVRDEYIAGGYIRPIGQSMPYLNAMSID